MKKQLSLAFLAYLRLLARLQLAKKPYQTIIGVTGSAGKTSTLLATAAALTPNLKVKTSLKGGNSESGIPLSILDLSITSYSFCSWLKIALLAPVKLLVNWQKYDVFVVEMGIDSPHPPKNMAYLLSIIRPQMGVFLNVNPVHGQFFSSLDQIARHKAQLINSLPPAGRAFLNLSDPLVKKYSHPACPITNISPQSSTKQKLSKIFPFLPKIYNTSLNAAIKIAQALSLSPHQAAANLKANFHLPPSRSTILKGIKNSQIIDSSYNSSPSACLAMLDFLAAFPQPRIAVLGDMRELGRYSSKYHRQIYQKATKIAKVISVGPQTKKYFGPKAKKFLYWWQALNYLQSHPELVSKSHILVKGSQNTIYLEELVKSLLKNKNDASRICRQSKYWLNLKAKFKKSNA